MTKEDRLPKYKEYSIWCPKPKGDKTKSGWICPADCIDCEYLAKENEFGISCWYPKRKDDT